MKFLLFYLYIFITATLANQTEYRFVLSVKSYIEEGEFSINQ